MSLPLIIFYLLSAVTLLSAWRVITTHHPVHAVLFLILAFFSSAGLWVMLRAEFLAIVLLLIYVGAVMVFFLFVVMMLNIKIEKMRLSIWRHARLALLVAFIMVVELVLIFMTVKSPTIDAMQEKLFISNNAQILGTQLYTTYLLPFELVSLLLVLAMVAAITLSMQCLPTAKPSNQPSEQVKVNRQDRIYKVNLRHAPSAKADQTEETSC
ncbi:MAG: NADH-quinone oxidoreductase subunit J [Neisseriales bacterium]|nr:MAG: NADH-quinone oxidoreductase subunit J [Neisseriales bacterium]